MQDYVTSTNKVINEALARACLETAPCREVRRSVEGGACPPAQNGPWLLIGVLGFPNQVLGSAQASASAWALGAGTEVLTLLPMGVQG